jgi:Tol biopolymer transport system component
MPLLALARPTQPTIVCTGLPWGGGDRGKVQIYTVDMEGRALRRLTNFPGGAWNPRWAPDGSRIVFNASGRLSFMDPDGGSVEHLLLPVSNPDWSPDGRHIAFLLSPDGFSLHLYTLDLDTGRKRRLVSDRRITNASWHPNGEEILFSAYDPSSETGDIWIIRRDGTNLRQITRNRRGVVTYHAHLFDPGLAVSPMGKKATTWGGMKGRVQRRDRAGRTGSR